MDDQYQFKLLLRQQLKQYNRHNTWYGLTSKKAEKSFKQLNILMDVHVDYHKYKGNKRR